MNYTLTRSKRKTMALCVRDGTVEVRAPLEVPKDYIDRFVASKEKWILDKLEKSQEHAEQREAFTVNYGDIVTACGRQYTLTSRPGDRIGFTDDTFYMPPDLPAEKVKYACVLIFRLLAKRELTEKALGFAKKMSVMPGAVKVNGAKTRWGSCSSKKNLNFSWRLIMADDDVVDYVVVHELAHITEMNHSDRFWAIVEGILPDYKERQKRLKELQHRLNNEDWE